MYQRSQQCGDNGGTSVLCSTYRSVCFSRSASLHHHLSGPVGNMGQNEFIVPGTYVIDTHTDITIGFVGSNPVFDQLGER